LLNILFNFPKTNFCITKLNKMKKYFLLALFLTPVFVFAQVVKTSKDFKLDISDPYPVVDGSKKWYFVHGDQLLAIKFRGSMTYQLFDLKTMKPTNTSSIDKKSGGMPRGYIQEEFIQQGERILEFYNVWDKPNLTEQVYYRDVGFDTPNKGKKGTLILKSKKRLKNNMGQNKIDVYQSFDKSKILIVYELRKTETKDALNFQTFGLVVFNDEMEELWRKEVKMPYSEKEIENMGYTLDNNGNAYMLLRKKSKEAKNPLELLKVSEGGKENTIKIDAGGKFFPRGIKLEQGNDNKLYCVGYYGGSIAAQGIYMAILNNDGEVENEKFHEIPLAIINQNKSDRAQERGEKRAADGVDIGIDHLSLDQIKVQENGDVLLIGEVYFIITTPGSSTITNTTYFKEILVTKLDGQGKLLWMKKLVKNQVQKKSFSSSYGMGIVSAIADRVYRYNNKEKFDLSFQYINTDKNHYFLYLDNIKNLNLPLNKYPARHSSKLGGFLTAYKVNDETGEVAKLSLFDLRDLKGYSVTQFNTDRIVQKSESEILVELYKKKKQDILLSIKIQEAN